MTLLSVAEARALMLSACSAGARETVDMAEAAGRTLAAPVRARRDQPPFHASAMDGYGLRAAAAPARLRVVGEAHAGAPYPRALQPGEAVRISTGAALPEGADAVLVQEQAVLEGADLLAPALAKGLYVRPRGLDFRAGDVLLEPGRTVDAVALAFAAAAGCSRLEVHRRPRVAILSGGDEIVAPGQEPRPDQVFDSASFGVAALAQTWGGETLPARIAHDSIEAFAERAGEALAGADLVVVIGGASVGPRDHARPAVQSLGLALQVDGVAVRPGKPTWFGQVGRTPVLGLPGNPASALVCARLFLAPMLDALLGRPHDHTLTFETARLAEALPANGPREHYLRASALNDGEGGLRIRALEDQDSSRLSVFANANALLRLAPHAPALQAGALVEALRL